MSINIQLKILFSSELFSAGEIIFLVNCLVSLADALMTVLYIPNIFTVANIPSAAVTYNTIFRGISESMLVNLRFKSIEQVTC